MMRLTLHEEVHIESNKGEIQKLVKQNNLMRAHHTQNLLDFNLTFLSFSNSNTNFLH